MKRQKMNRPNLLAMFAGTLFFACVTLVVFTPAASSSTQQPAAAEKTVEQVRKNIKVLNGLPDSQLIPTMNFISASLGIRCPFCHINKEGKWDFVSDEKPEKNTAREMIKMVLAVNKGTFRGNTEVSCFTCHRGQTKPVSSPMLPLPAPTPRPVAAETKPAETKPAEAAPTAEQILAKYTEVLGGTAAVEKIKTRTMKGTWITSSGAALEYEISQSAPDNFHAILNTPQASTERGFDGYVGWEKSARGLRSLEGEELSNLRRSARLLRDIDLKSQFSSLTLSGKDKIGDREVYVLRGTTIDNRHERLCFDVQNGLLVRRSSNTPTMIGVIPEQIDFEDYRSVDGVMMPFTLRISSVDPNNSFTRKYSEIKLNAPVDESKFHKPNAPAPTPTP